MYAQDSIDLLQNSGIQFKKHEDEGIEPLEFAELLMSSGIVLMDNIKWLSFHSGYDFGYLIKLLTDNNLPQDETEFFELLKMYFPTIYDVKVRHFFLLLCFIGGVEFLNCVYLFSGKYRKKIGLLYLCFSFLVSHEVMQEFKRGPSGGGRSA